MDKPTAFAHQLLDYLGGILIKFFGSGYLGGELSVAIINSALPDDVIITKGIVREKTVEGSSVKLFLDVWCKNQRGEKIIVGKASGFVS